MVDIRGWMGMSEKPSLGEQELEVLRFIAERAPVTARAVVEGVAGERGLARTTILTVIARLRRKGYLTRRRRDGVFLYAPREPQSELLQRLVGQFVEKTLGGSVSPVIAYLLQTRRLTDAEVKALEQLVEELREEGKEEQP
jgi:predicted transcriptional regulator